MGRSARGDLVKARKAPSPVTAGEIGHGDVEDRRFFEATGRVMQHLSGLDVESDPVLECRENRVRHIGRQIDGANPLRLPLSAVLLGRRTNA